MLKIVLDRSMCVGSGECLKGAPTAFAHDEDGFAYVTDPASVDEMTLRIVEEECPSGAIRLVDDEH